MRDNCNDFTCPNKCVPTPLLIQVSSDYEFEKATSLDDKTHYRKELWECVDCGQLFTVFCDVVAVEKLESTIIND